uniref:adenylate kinase 7 isoform X3 n=1 Tax=Jaculus jaculus TaxID=51337 RepID=UPI001E1B5DDF|nr:adenylate kinase 7 isoform X3 [Jaculus jaculus]
MAEEEGPGPAEKVLRVQRVFISVLDSYSSGNLGKYLANCVAGASLEEITEEEEEDETKSAAQEGRGKEGTFQIVGTLAKPDSPHPNFAVETYSNLSREELLMHLMECDVIIYNITTEHAQQVEEAIWAASALNEEIKHFEKRKLFILLSTVMTWAQSKPLDPLAWMGETPALPVFGDGMNIIPAIHILDLAGVIQNVIDHVPKFHYLVAVDESVHTLEDLVKCISKHTGPGKIQKVPKENAFLTKELTQEHIDHLLVNLRMEALFVKENFNIRWVAQTGFVENINSILKEYKLSRGLMPIKICILGPPAVGKSSIAEELAKHYKLHHIKLKDVVSEAIAKLESIVALKDTTGEEEVEEEEQEENVEEAQELLEGIKENMEQNAGRLEDQYIIRFMKEKLKSMPCRNQGYILDGYPKTYDQAKELFNQEDDEDDDEMRGKMFPINELITPEFVCGLDASDEFLKERVINLPESVVAGTHYSQDRFLRALSNYRDINTDDETVFNYFDEIEVHPIYIDVGKLEDAQNRLAIKKLIKEIGEPRNYGLTEEEKAEEEKRRAEECLAREAAKQAEYEHKEATETAERIARWEEWSQRLEEVKRQERELLEAQSVPLRNYLMTYVMPTLMQGLNECCKLRPDDPIDFLAEYLFKNNPEMQ